MGAEELDTAAGVGADGGASRDVVAMFAAATAPLVPTSAIEKPGATSRALLCAATIGSGFAAAGDGPAATADPAAISDAFSGKGETAGRSVWRNVDCKTGGPDDAGPSGKATADFAVRVVGAGVGFGGDAG